MLNFKNLTPKQLIIGVVSVLAFIGYEFGYRYLTGNQPTNEIRWSENLTWTLPFSLPSFIDILTATIMVSISIYFWYKKGAEMDKDEILTRMLGGFIIATAIGLIMVSANMLLQFPAIPPLRDVLMIFAVWACYFSASFRKENRFKSVFEQITSRQSLSEATGLALGTAILILPSIGTIATAIVIVIGVVIFQIAGVLFYFIANVIILTIKKGGIAIAKINAQRNK